MTAISILDAIGGGIRCGLFIKMGVIIKTVWNNEIPCLLCPTTIQKLLARIFIVKIS